MKILKSKEMAYADKNTIELTGIPSLVLMENAGRTAAQIILERYPECKKFSVVAGSGNNGGDGLVIGRYLKKYGKEVKVFLLASSRDKLSQDNLKNLEIYESFGGEVYLITEKNIPKIRNGIKDSEVIIDAIFGTGFTPPVKGYREKVIKIIDSYYQKKKIVSVDVPSGLSTDYGKVDGTYLRADITVTFAYPKVSHILYPSSLFCGDVYVIDISIDESYVKEIHRYLLTKENILLPERKKDSHKYSYGHLLVIGGSVGKTGAVIMSSKTGTVSGAGLVTAVIPKSVNSIVEMALTEEMTIPVEDENGVFGKNSHREIREIVKKGKFTSIAVGMGMSVSESCVSVIEEILKLQMPVVIDADGLNNLRLIEGFKKRLKKRKYPTVLTPHIGEMSRLTGLKTTEIVENMEDVAVSFSSETGCYVVLKGSRTLISTPDGKVFYSIKGNEGMATAGTGDVLAGIIGTLIYRLGVEEGVKTAVYIHGLSGDLAVKDIGAESLKATDLIRYIPKAYNYLKNIDIKTDHKFYRTLSTI